MEKDNGGKMGDKKVSVVIALYNCESYLERCIESILKQTYQNFEIIICDDCSTDNSYQVALNMQKKDSRIKVIRNSSNQKSAATRNKCIENSCGEYVFIQDADDYVDRTTLEKEVNILANEKDISFVSVGMYRFNSEQIWGQYLSRKEYPSKKDFLWCLPFVHAGTMFRKNVLEEVKRL